MNILVIGNCQASSIAELIKATTENVQIIGVIIVHLAKETDAEAHRALCEEADVILAQQVASNYPVPHVSTDAIRSHSGDKTISWINVFFQGQNPDLYYVTAENGARIVGPTDVYQSKAVIDLWKEGVKASDVNAKTYLSQTTTVEVLQYRVEQSFADLKMREHGIDVGMHDYIIDNWTVKPLFHTFNHPNIGTMLELCRRICQKIDIPFQQHDHFADSLSVIIPPIEENMAATLGLQFPVSTEIHGLEVAENLVKTVPGKKVVYAFSDYVDTAFRCYDAQKDRMGNLRYTPATA